MQGGFSGHSAVKGQGVWEAINAVFRLSSRGGGGGQGG